MSWAFHKLMNGALIKQLIATFFCLSILACQAETQKSNQVENKSKTIESIHSDYLVSAEVKNLKLEVFPQQGICAIRLNNSSDIILLDIPYPCGFVHHKKKPAQTYYYEGIGHVFAIAGPVASQKEYPEGGNVNFSHKCSMYGQPFIVNDNKLKLLKSQSNSLHFCHGLGFDEKSYYGFSHFESYLRKDKKE